MDAATPRLPTLVLFVCLLFAGVSCTESGTEVEPWSFGDDATAVDAGDDEEEADADAAVEPDPDIGDCECRSSVDCSGGNSCVLMSTAECRSKVCGECRDVSGVRRGCYCLLLEDQGGVVTCVDGPRVDTF